GSRILINGDSEAQNKVMNLVKESFKPEFINRIDEIIIFNPLSKEVQVKIVDKLLKELQIRLENQKINFSFTQKVKSRILDVAYDPDYGARPIKRYIQHHIESLIAKEIISSNISPNNNYTLDIINEDFIIK
ncbi:MAG: hypothetical protein WC154_07250, partial [Candidatus Izemoplasmatales bacterium]